MKPEEIARLIPHITRKITDHEWNRAGLCALLEDSCKDEAEFRRLSKIAGTSHQSLHRWASVYRYFNNEDMKRQRTETEAFRTHVKWWRKDVKA
jgi:hypothetical protein